MKTLLNRMENKQNRAIVLMVNFQLQMKVFHWQTTSYAQHMAFGAIYDYLDGAIDKFVEMLQGRSDRINFDDAGLKIQKLTDEAVNGSVEEFGKLLVSLSSYFDTKADSDLLNLRDEMLGEINKLKFLLSLK